MKLAYIEVWKKNMNINKSQKLTHVTMSMKIKISENN